MYHLTYWQNNKPTTYGYFFQSLWAAIFKARAITESYGFPTDVLDASTGAVMVEFEPESPRAVYIDCDVPKDIQTLALTPLW